MKYIKRLKSILGKDVRVYITEEAYISGTLLEVNKQYIVVRSNLAKGTICERIIPLDTIMWFDVDLATIGNKVDKINIVNKFNNILNL